MKKYNFCNNCGKQGHLFHQCNHPIISSGIIAFRKGTEGIEFLLICRKDSLGYIDFLRGKYPLYNKIYIQNLIDEMTIYEKRSLIKKNKRRLNSFSKIGRDIGLLFQIVDDLIDFKGKTKSAGKKTKRGS